MDGQGQRPATNPVEDLVSALLGAWLIAGFFLDTWAHLHVGQIESVITPWHAVLYSGYLALTLWTLELVRRRHVPGSPWASAVPIGYGVGLIGLVVFAIGGAADLIGHVLFGFEKSLGAWIAPFHLLVFTGIGLAALSPFRAAWARPDRGGGSLDWFVPAVLPLALTTALVCQVMGFLTLFQSSLPTLSRAELVRAQVVGLSYATVQSAALGQIFVTGLFLTGPVLLILRRWRPPNGTMTILFGVIAGLLGIVHNFAPKGPLVAAVLTGVAADGLVRILRPTDRAWGHRVIAMAVPGVLASLYLAALAARKPLPWEGNVLGGAILIAMIGGLALSALIRPGTDRQVGASSNGG
jgi:hypothetical protein